jgi:hypothetical protein
MDHFEKLASGSTLLILSYAPAGLGHLRVTNALYRGLPPQVTPVLLGADDTSITAIHRLTSISKPLKKLMEWSQNGWPQDIFTYFYGYYLRINSKPLYRQISALLKQRVEVPKTIIFVATHFGLAHQLAAIKETLAKQTKTQIILAVVVTDDSPQYIWCVPGADITFVPSYTTKNLLLGYSRKNHWKSMNFCVTPYPISPRLAAKSDTVFENRHIQIRENSESKIHIAVPI